VGPFLLRGLGVAEVALADAVSDLKSGLAQLWAILAPRRVLGAFLTSVRVDGGLKWVEVCALSGVGAPKWAKALAHAVEGFARSEGASRTVFFGKRGWARLLPDYTNRGAVRPGTYTFERAI